MATADRLTGHSGDTFAAELRRLRQRSRLTLEALAESSGVSVRTIGGLERGRSLGPQRRTVTALADALGLGGPDRVRLEELAEVGRPRPMTAPAGWCVPPRPVPDFAGREAELAHLATVSATGTGTPVTVLSGPGGIGKTTLAVRAARLIADSRGLEVLYVNLRGLDPEPSDAHLALFRLLKALGVADREIHDDVDGRSGQFRTLFEQRPAVLILDNARDEEQVRPLLPGAGTGLVLVTSRRLLTGLEGVHRLSVPTLQDAEGLRLLGSIVGDVEGPRGEGLGELVAVCGGLPLALRIVGNRLATRPAWTARELARRLADSGRRLEQIRAGDLRITAAFRMSYDQLSPSARRLCRRLSLVPGPDFDVALAAVVGGSPSPRTEDVLDTEEVLEELHELGLLSQSDDGRYGFHDLIRLFAAERLAAEEDPAGRANLLRSTVEWLLRVTTAAGRWFDPEHGVEPPDWRQPVDLSTSEAADAWLRAESDNWFGAVRVAADQGWDRIVVETADAVHWFSNQWMLWAHWHELFTLSAAAAQRVGDPVAHATQLYNLSWATAQQGDTEEAVASALEAARIAERAGAVRQRAWALHFAARARQTTDPAASLPYSEQSEQLFAEVGDWTGHTSVLMSVAVTLLSLGEPAAAIEKLRTGLEIARRPPAGGAWQTIADVLLTSGHFYLATAYQAVEEYDLAESAFRVAADNAARTGMTLHRGRVEVKLAQLQHRRGRLVEAVSTLALARERFMEVDAAEEITAAQTLLTVWGGTDEG
ncbi:helix-turn-helix domain-containing protein [Kitasatospora sp. NPDC094015]|uniref:helix-turn-helix domain-containing protein n=1 Tax=Kitasatospora sp. NPDC094015 TaxID=3155205 RepID=UPI00331DF838